MTALQKSDGQTGRTNPAAALWADAYADEAQFARNEAERNRPQPIFTMTLLMVIAIAAYVVGLTTGILPNPGGVS